MAVMVFRSAWIPAPPEGSEPAMVNTVGDNVGWGQYMEDTWVKKRIYFITAPAWPSELINIVKYNSIARLE
jgi:hypothetical protein